MSIRLFFHYLGRTILTIGASLITGLLSFSGFYAIRPDLFYSSCSFILAVVFEGQIYFENIDDSLKVLIDPEYSALQLSNSILRDELHDDQKIQNDAFYQTFIFNTQKLNALKHEVQTKNKKKQQEKIQELLDQQKIEFLHRLLSDENFKTLNLQKTQYERVAQLFLVTVAISMSFGTVFLLIEAFTIIPFLSAIPLTLWPSLIIPMAIIGGLAYAIQLFKTLNNIITHQKIQKRLYTLYHQLKTEGLNLTTLKPLLLTLSLTSLALLLTFCTLGTWVTIIKHAPNTFKWLFIFPKIAFIYVIPLLSATSAFIFNLENSNESVEVLESLSNYPIQLNFLKNILNHIKTNENWAQKINPFRLFLFLFFTPIRFLIFLAHLTSMSFLQNQVPNFSDILASFFGFLNELLTDLHYFFPQDHDHDLDHLLDEQLLESEEDHHHDFPTRLLRLITVPLYALSLLWDYIFSQWNSAPEQQQCFEIVCYKILHRILGDTLLYLWEPVGLETRLKVPVTPVDSFGLSSQSWFAQTPQATATEAQTKIGSDRHLPTPSLGAA